MSISISSRRRMLFLAATIILMPPPLLCGQIHEAARDGNLNTIKTLIAGKPELVNTKDENGRTPLHWATRGVHLDIVKLLVENGADVNARDGNQTAPLHSLAVRNQTEAIRMLLEKGAEINARNYGGTTPLHYASIYDAGDAAAVLIEHGAELEIRDNYGRTPLLLCARERGGPDTARVLLKAGAAVNARDKYGDTPLDLSAWRGKQEFVALLLDAGAAVPRKGPSTRNLFQEAASRGLSRLFEELIKAGGDPSFELPTGGTLLHSAAAGGATDIVEALAARGMDINGRDDFGWSPLHYACRDGRLDVVPWLLEKGADKDARTIMGQSPLNVAEEMKQQRVRDLLAGRGADTGPMKFPILEGDYFGQELPGDRPEIFARGIISSVWPLHSAVAFSPDGNMAMWAPMMMIPGKIYSQGGIKMSERRNGRWTAPRWAPFTGEVDGDVPFFSPDGKRVFFISTRALPGMQESRKERIWYVERKGEGWGAPQAVDSAVNDYPQHWHFSLDKDQTLYFSTSISDGFGEGDLYCSPHVEGHWQAPVNLGPAVNSGRGEEMPFISPDGDYLLFSRELDLYISFRQADGSWTKARKLDPPINSPGMEICPMVTPDGKYFIYLCTRENKRGVWWMKADFIDRLRN